MFRKIRPPALLLAAVILLCCTGCGGAGSPPPPAICGPRGACAVGGTVSGLHGGGLVLQDNGGDSLSVAASGTFNFSTPVAWGSFYSVSLLTEPSDPAQYCLISQGTGVISGAVTTVEVQCQDAVVSGPAPKDWTWMDGDDFENGIGIYGTLGLPGPGNGPGGRYGAVAWRDASGNFWLFGGEGSGGSWQGGNLNDLWEYSNGELAWKGGSSGINQAGIYGTKGVPAPGNWPGGRNEAVGWVDLSGCFWLFGGTGQNAAGAGASLNDLWRYCNGQWAWMAGSEIGTTDTQTAAGIYGARGMPSPENTPGSRFAAMSWADAEGNLWLFGGSGFDSQGTGGSLNDLWRYEEGDWTWMSGSDLVDQFGSYGTLGIAAPGNIPGARVWAATWTDVGGDLWLFGGLGNDVRGCQGALVCLLNDLWKYDGANWTWMGGADVVDQAGVYGTQGAASPGNTPGARSVCVNWTDTAGNFWLFGGGGCDAEDVCAYDLNDLWEYSGGQWTWVSGSTLNSQLGTYGTFRAPSRLNVPDAREFSVGWIDKSGNLWLFGGSDALNFNAQGGGQLNDLWQYQQ